MKGFVNRRFALRVNSRGSVPFSILYRGQNSAGDGIVRELSRFGCRILGNDPVDAGETLNLQLSLPASKQPLFIEQATVQWVTGLEFGLVFKGLRGREADRLERLLDALSESGSSSGRPAGSLDVKPPAA